MPEIPSALFVEVEAVAGTAETVAGSNVVDCTKNDWTLMDGAPIHRPVHRFHQDRVPRKKAPNRYWKIDLAGEVKAATAAGSAPEIGPLLRCSGLTQTLTGGVSAAYTLTNDPIRTKVSCTCVRNDAIGGPRSYIASGVQFGDWQFEFDSGGTLMWSCTGIGRYTRPGAVETSVAVSDYNTGVPFTAVTPSTGFEMLSYADLVVSKLGWALGNEVKPRPYLAAGAADFGYDWPGNIVRGAESPVTWSCEVEPVAEGTLGLFAALEAATTFDWLATFTAGSRVLSVSCGGSTLDNPAIQTSGTDPVLYSLSGAAGRVGTTGALVMTWT